MQRQDNDANNTASPKMLSAHHQCIHINDATYLMIQILC